MRGLIVTTALALQALAGTLSVTDIDGKELSPLRPPGPAEVLFFITHDCPISNFYAPEIQRICGQYGSQGVSCALVYVDPQMDAAEVRRHLNDFGYKGIPAILDGKHKVVGAAGAKVTPEAIVVGHDGKILYSGRI